MLKNDEKTREVLSANSKFKIGDFVIILVDGRVGQVIGVRKKIYDSEVRDVEQICPPYHVRVPEAYDCYWFYEFELDNADGPQTPKREGEDILLEKSDPKIEGLKKDGNNVLTVPCQSEEV